MDEREAGLSERSAAILGLIAEGRSYDQILQQQPDVTYFDVFAAAREALDLLQVPEFRQPAPQQSRQRPTAQSAPEVTDIKVADAEVPSAVSLPSFIERARKTHGRAWARWTPDEDARLTALFSQGESRDEIVRQLGRQPGAVRSRLVKLGLIAEADDTGARPDPVVAHEAQPWVPDAVEAPNRSDRTPAGPVVPGWEALRDRLTPGRETP